MAIQSAQARALKVCMMASIDLRSAFNVENVGLWIKRSTIIKLPPDVVDLLFSALFFPGLCRNWLVILVKLMAYFDK